MRRSSFVIAAALTAAVSLAGCASDGIGPLTTASLPSGQPAQTAEKTSPQQTACLALQDRIALLRSDGTVDRVEKAAAGKTKVVSIKRASLTKVAELNAANAEYQAKCSVLPAQTATPAAPVATSGESAKVPAATVANKAASATEEVTR
jgi:hypothetical protein